MAVNPGHRHRRGVAPVISWQLPGRLAFQAECRGSEPRLPLCTRSSSKRGIRPGGFPRARGNLAREYHQAVPNGGPNGPVRHSRLPRSVLVFVGAHYRLDALPDEAPPPPDRAQRDLAAQGQLLDRGDRPAQQLGDLGRAVIASAAVGGRALAERGGTVPAHAPCTHRVQATGSRRFRTSCDGQPERCWGHTSIPGENVTRAARILPSGATIVSRCAASRRLVVVLVGVVGTHGDRSWGSRRVAGRHLRRAASGPARAAQISAACPKRRQATVTAGTRREYVTPPAEISGMCCWWRIVPGRPCRPITRCGR